MRPYRDNAWNAHRRALHLGTPLELTASTSRAVYHAAVAAFLVMLGALLCIPVRDEASGRGFVRLVGARTIASIADGPVEQVLAKPGAHVKSGQPVIVQYSAEQAAELERLTKEFDGWWTRLLADSLDSDARQALAVTGPALRRARTRLDECTARSPIDGVVTDVRVTEGRHIAKGETLFVVAPEHAAAEIVAVLPASVGPKVTARSACRFWLDGADANVMVTLAEVRSDGIGPSEVARLLGPTMQGSVAVEGMSFVVTGSLDESTFVEDGRKRAFFQGMSGRLDVTLDKKPLLFLLVPGLRRWVYR